MDFRETHVKADVLIIGGGSAGAMAAIRAKEVDPWQEVLVFEKGQSSTAGASPGNGRPEHRGGPRGDDRRAVCGIRTASPATGSWTSP